MNVENQEDEVREAFKVFDGVRKWLFMTLLLHHTVKFTRYYTTLLTLPKQYITINYYNIRVIFISRP